MGPCFLQRPWLFAFRLGRVGRDWGPGVSLTRTHLKFSFPTPEKKRRRLHQVPVSEILADSAPVWERPKRAGVGLEGGCPGRFVTFFLGLIASGRESELCLSGTQQALSPGWENLNLSQVTAAGSEQKCPYRGGATCPIGLQTPGAVGTWGGASWDEVIGIGQPKCQITRGWG